MKIGWTVLGMVAVLAMPTVTNAQGVVGGTQQGASQGAREGSKAGIRQRGRSEAQWAARSVELSVALLAA